MQFLVPQVVSRGFGFGPFVDLGHEKLRRRRVSHTDRNLVGLTAVPLIASPGGSGVIFFLFRSTLGSNLLPPLSLWLPLRVATRLFAAMSETRKTRIVVSLDPPPSASTSSSSDSLSLDAVLAADAALGFMPGVSFASIYAGQLALKRELDRTVSHTQNMQLQIDSMSVEIAALKRRRV